MTDYQELLQTLKALQPTRLGYIELLQEEVKRNRDRPPERYNTEEDADDVARSASATKPQHGQAHQLTVPYSIPRALAVAPSLGGEPVSPELAASLRKILFGNVFHIFNYEWKKSFFRFREPYSVLSYALEAERGGARAIQMVVQANIIKYLLFSQKTNSDCYCIQSLEEMDEKQQERALAAALADILWMAGEEQATTVALVTSECCFSPLLDYKPDNFTEKLQLFNFVRKEETEKFIYEHIQCFKEEGSHGVILFLYSLILSRTIHRNDCTVKDPIVKLLKFADDTTIIRLIKDVSERLREDLDRTTSHLLQQSLGNFVCRQALLNLLLTGRANPHVFNGTVLYDENGDVLEQPLHGVLARSDVGYLHWSRERLDQGKLPVVGSMLKTPKLPIWVCGINDTYSVLFSPNRSLLSDWKMEHLFSLYFYNGQSTQTSTAVLSIDTHSHHWELEKRIVQGDPEKRFPSVEMTIRTKWEGAAIDWNGTVPFF